MLVLDEFTQVLDFNGPTNHLVEAGKCNKMNLAVLTVWRERGGQWRLLARQAAKAE